MKDLAEHSQLVIYFGITIRGTWEGFEVLMVDEENESLSDVSQEMKCQGLRDDVKKFARIKSNRVGRWNWRHLGLLHHRVELMALSWWTLIRGWKIYQETSKKGWNCKWGWNLQNYSQSDVTSFSINWVFAILHRQSSLKCENFLIKMQIFIIKTARDSIYRLVLVLCVNFPTGNFIRSHHEVNKSIRNVNSSHQAFQTSIFR